MTISLQRKKLHQVLDIIPDKHLNTVEYYLTRLAYVQSAKSNLELTNEDQQLLALVEQIQQTPFNLDNITYPTKSWEDYGSEIDKPLNTAFDVTKWNEQWDKIESQMKAASLTHEIQERQQD